MATKQGRPTGGPASLNKSHKSFQPVLPCGNKLLQQKWDQTYYNQHRKLVKSAKPMVDTKPPPIRPHVISKLKKQQLERERGDEIDRDNFTLLKKMQKIMKIEGSEEYHNTYRHHSLNQLQRQRELERVAKENKELLKRLEKVEPMYKVSDWIDDWQKNAELMELITSYPEDTIDPLARSERSSKQDKTEDGESSPVEVDSSTEGPPGEKKIIFTESVKAEDKEGT